MENHEPEGLPPTLKVDTQDIYQPEGALANNHVGDGSSSLPSAQNVQKIEILMVGLDNAGKTTLHYALKLGQVTETIRTIGYNVETLGYNGTNYEIWEIGGLKSVRVLRNFYMENKSFVIYVVDAADGERFEEAQQDLHDVMSNTNLKDVVLIVLANKMDLVPQFVADDLVKHLKLETLKQKYKIHACSAIKDGNSLREILELLHVNKPEIKTTIYSSQEIAADNQNSDESSSLPGASADNVQKVEILMIGLDNAGKTTLLYALYLGYITENIRTIGYNVETMEYNGKNYEIWEIGGLKSIRALRKFYTENKSFVIYVVDAADAERFEEAQQDLHDVMSNTNLNDVVLIVLANKMDLVPQFVADDLVKHLKLETLKQKYKIHACSAIKDGKRLREIFELLQN